MCAIKKILLLSIVTLAIVLDVTKAGRSYLYQSTPLFTFSQHNIHDDPAVPSLPLLSYKAKQYPVLHHPDASQIDANSEGAQLYKNPAAGYFLESSKVQETPRYDAADSRLLKESSEADLPPGYTSLPATIDVPPGYQLFKKNSAYY